MIDQISIIGKIYDCAANPELWSEALTSIRDGMNGAFATIGFARHKMNGIGAPEIAMRATEWDPNWFKALSEVPPAFPGVQKMAQTDVDQVWVQMHQCTADEFSQTAYYQNFIAPKKLLDVMNLNYLRRPATSGLFTLAGYESRGLFTAADVDALAGLSPHLRRAILINEMVASERQQTTLLRKLLGSIPTAIFIIGNGQKISFANAAAETMLSDEKFLLPKNGSLATSINGASQLALNDAIARASQGDSALGIRGIGVPLTAQGGERAAAYVLPIAGNDIRREMGDGYCAIFVAQRGEQLPVTIEILRTMFDMTSAEARTAALVAQGDKPQDIADSLGVALSTIRTQIAKASSKANVDSMVALSGLVNSLVPHVTS